MTGTEGRREVTHGDIFAGLRELGIASGDGVMVHSSLSSFGRVAGGARTVIEALMEAVGPGGNLMMPSFNHGGAYGRKGPGYFDPTETPTSNGAVPDLFWRMPGVRRSVHPTHSFAAIGPKATEYIDLHHRTLTTGPASPLGMLWRDGGWGLFIGVGYRANTFRHVVEATTRVPCLSYRTQAYSVRLPDGRTVEARSWGWREGTCPLKDKTQHAEAMAPYERHTTVGESDLTLFKLDDCFRVTSELLASGTDDCPGCSECPVRPRRDERTVESDWDFEVGKLRPDSPAWGY